MLKQFHEKEIIILKSTREVHQFLENIEIGSK